VTITLPPDPPTWFTVAASVTAGRNRATVVTSGVEPIEP